MAHPRPSNSEYNSYYQPYIDLVPNGELGLLFSQNLEYIEQIISTIPEELADYAYAQGKWTVKELLGHIIDTERVMSYRALVGLRMDTEAILPNMDQDVYVAHRDVSRTNLNSLKEEWKIVRKSTIKLYETANEKNLSTRIKTHAGEVTPLALAYIMIGHAIHHIQVLQEKYLTK